MDYFTTFSYPIARIFIITSRQKPKDCDTVTERIILFLLRVIVYIKIYRIYKAMQLLESL